MMRIVPVGAVILGMVLFPQPSESQSPRTSPLPQTAQRQVEELRKEVAGLRNEVVLLRKETVDLQTRTFKLELSQGGYQSVVLDLTSRDYQRLDTSNGSFLVSVQDASPYLDGYRVVLNVGNPSFATYTGFKVKVRWNSNYDWNKFTQEGYDAWNKNMREKEIAFTDSLSPGSWNRVELLLPTTTGQQLGYLALSMETNVVVLYKRQ